MGASPSKAVLLPETLVRDRYRFLQGIRKHHPEFWISLRRWHLKSVNDRRVGSIDWLAIWAQEWKVVDDWFRGALADTLAHWAANPDSPAARLLDGAEWFHWAATAPVGPFAPVLQRPSIQHNGAADTLFGCLPDMTNDERVGAATTVLIEPIDDFCKRVRGDFEEQLKAYKRYLRAMLPEGEPPERAKHAEWAACVFCRVPRLEIAAKWPGLTGSADAYGLVIKQVGRFASQIGLTLPKRSDTD